MIKFRDMMEMVINGQDSIICAVKDANADNAMYQGNAACWKILD